MSDIRWQQQKIIAEAFYLSRVCSDLNGDVLPGSQDGDWNTANKILNHFEMPFKDSCWVQEEEDWNEYRRLLLPEYLEHVKSIKEEFDNETCGD